MKRAAIVFTEGEVWWYAVASSDEHASSPDGKRRCLISQHGWADPYVHNAFSGQYASEMCDCAKFEGDE